MIIRALHIPTDWEWVREHVQCVLCADTKGVVAEEDGQIKGVAIADSWSFNSCQAHIAATTPMVWRHGLHKEYFKWIFQQTGRDLIIGLTPANNERAIKFNRKIGFKQTYRVTDGYDKGVDYVVFEMMKSECKFLEMDSESDSKRAA